jgi:hypothetical protein
MAQRWALGLTCAGLVVLCGATAEAEERQERYGVIIGASLPEAESFASRGRHGEGYRVGRSALLGAFTEISLNARTRLTVEVVYGPYAGNASEGYFTSYPLGSEWADYTRASLTPGVQLTRIVKRGTTSPWVGIAVGATTTWHDNRRGVRFDSRGPYTPQGPDRYKYKGGRLASDLSSPLHLAVGIDFERPLRVEMRGGPVFSHPQAPAPYGLGSVDYRWDMQFRLCLFLPSRSRG